MLSWILLGAACRPLTLTETPPPAPTLLEWQTSVDWEATGAEVVELLSGYLRVDTVNPPGNETLGADYLGSWLAREGIPYQIYEFAPGRGSLVARLKGSGEAAPLCLLSHIDVVPSEEALWPPGKGPLSGVVDEAGYLWGRGALDMKGMGAIELMTLLLLHRQGVPLKRDVILMAVADEEVAGLGVQHLAENYWGELGCEYVINEGGLGVEGLFFEGQTVYPISVGEKGFLWLKVVATGEPGHGSVPRPEHAPVALREALKALEEREEEPTFHPAMEELLAKVGRQKGGALAFILERPALARAAVEGKMMENPLTRAALTNTLNVTGFGGANSPNVLPSEVYFQIDSRLLPGTSPEVMLAEIQGLLYSVDGLRFEVLGSTAAGVTEWEGDPFYGALVRNIEEDRENVVAGPVISVGFTDSLYLRPLGVKAFGMVPFQVSQEELATMHGNGERVEIEQVREGLRILYEAVVEVAADPGGVIEAPVWGAASPVISTAPVESPWLAPSVQLPDSPWIVQPREEPLPSPWETGE